MHAQLKDWNVPRSRLVVRTTPFDFAAEATPSLSFFKSLLFRELQKPSLKPLPLLSLHLSPHQIF